MAQEYQQPVGGTASPRTQRMTAAESRAVIDLWQQERVEQTGLTDRPAVPDVAEGLDITVEDVQRLLSEVRARRLEEERKLAEVRRQRAALRQHQQPRQFVPRSQWVEIKPGVWEDAGLPGYSYVDFNQLAPNPQDASKQVQPLAIRFAAALAKVILLSLTLALVVAPVLYVLWCIFTVPHKG